MHRVRAAFAVMAVLLIGCDRGSTRQPALAGVLAGTEAPASCRAVTAAALLPAGIAESSGVSLSLRKPGHFWTINDEDDGALYLVDPKYRLAATFRVKTEAHDWEALATGRCGGEPCLMVGDVGDNHADRDHISILIVREPAPGDGPLVDATVLRARFESGPQNTESLFALPDGDLYLVTKGEHGPVVLYRYPAPYRPHETVVLERVRQLAPQQERQRDRVTGASASPDGRWVAIRTYRRLLFYDAGELVGRGPAEPALVVDLSLLAEPKGEGVAINDFGDVWLGSESRGEKRDGRSTIVHLRCHLPGSAVRASTPPAAPAVLRRPAG